MLKYTIAMSVRVVCIALCLVVHGWWILIPAAGAVFLPYFAVVIANNVKGRPRGAVQRPGAVVPFSPVESRPGRAPGGQAPGDQAPGDRAPGDQRPGDRP
jgi:hypothetical protein